MKALIGRKIGMTQVIQEDGTAVPVTLVLAGPCTVVSVRSQDTDGYSAIQLGFEEDSQLKKAQAGHAKKAKVSPKVLREFRADDIQAEIGGIIDVTEFDVGDVVTVNGTSKGKGFAGTIKRHNFHRGPMTHGSRNVRKPGSIGSMYPQKVYKGRKLPGRMGGASVSVKNQTVALVDKKNNVLGIRGAVPGPRNTIVTITGGAQ